MENVYVLVTYFVALIALVGCGLLKLGDILEKKRVEKYYNMVKEDAAFWQMKLEQSGITITDYYVVRTEKNDEYPFESSDEPKEADEKFKKIFEELDGLDEEITI